MDEAERFLRYWNAQARFSLQPAIRVDITDRTKSPDHPDGARCPWCGGELQAWFYGDQPEPPEVLCKTPDQHGPDEPWRWEKDQWGRLGVSTGFREDHRYGPRLPNVAAG
jgi:hypothetical protein